MTNGNTTLELDVAREQAKTLMLEVAQFLQENGQTAGEEIVRGLQHRVGALDFILVSTPNDLAQITQSTNHLRESLAKARDVLAPDSPTKKEQVFTNQGPTRAPANQTTASGWKKMVHTIGSGAQASGRAAKNAFWASAAAGAASWRFMQFLWRSVSIIGTIVLTLHVLIFFWHPAFPWILKPLEGLIYSPVSAALVWVFYIVSKMPHLATQRSGDEMALLGNVYLSLIPSHLLVIIAALFFGSTMQFPPWGTVVLFGGLFVVFAVLTLQLYFSMRLAERTGEFGIGASPH